MHIVRFSLLFLICLAGINISAQENISFIKKDTFKAKHHISVDASGLLRLFFNSEESSQSPIFVSWRKLGEKSNVRMGLALNISVLAANSDVASFLALKYKIGKERYADFGKRWQVFYGWDFLMQISNQSISGSDGSFGVGFGWGPVAGLHFKINERLWVSTETNYTLMASLNSVSGSSIFGFQGTFQAPNAILLGYRF